MEAITIVATGGVARCRNRDALVSQSACKLTDQPAIGYLVIQNDRITLTAGLANAAETGPDRLDIIRAENGSASRLVKDLVALVHDLDVLRCAHLAVGIGRSTVTTDTWERDSGKIEDWRRNAWRELAEQRFFCTAWSGTSLWTPVVTLGFPPLHALAPFGLAKAPRLASLVRRRCDRGRLP